MKEIIITWNRNYYTPDESQWDYQMGLKTREELKKEDFALIEALGETLEKFKKEAE